MSGGVPEPVAPGIHAERFVVADPVRRSFLEETAPQRAAGFWWRNLGARLFRWSPPPSRRWRNRLLRLFGAAVDPTARIAPSVRVDRPWNLRVGPGAIIEERVILECIGRIEIGEQARIERLAHLCAGSHDYHERHMPILRRPIRIGRRARIATDAFVGPGVSIGDGCFLAPRSSAFHDLPPGTVCVGEPARPRGRRRDPGGGRAVGTAEEHPRREGAEGADGPGTQAPAGGVSTRRRALGERREDE
jgi:putative colanic acid biosynthesis acetyltransferase WcaF